MGIYIEPLSDIRARAREREREKNKKVFLYKHFLVCLLLRHFSRFWRRGKGRWRKGRIRNVFFLRVVPTSILRLVRFTRVAMMRKQSTNNNASAMASKGCDIKYSADNDPLYATEQLLETLYGRDYWNDLCPHLTVAGVEEGGNRKQCVTASISAEMAAKHKSSLAENGFFKWKGAVSEAQVNALRRGVELLISHGWPPSFIYMYDEAWEIVEQLSEVLRKSSGGSLFLGDAYTWSVDPQKGARGWGPHRDRMGSGPASFRAADGTPMLSTTWLALSEASPDNSCLHVLPAYADPYYHKGDDPNVKNPLTLLFAEPDAYQDIRALPCAPGSLLHFSHRIIHWGSAAKNTGASPRVAMSWVVGDEAFEQPAFSREFLPQPPLAVRVAFVSAQLLSYGGQVNLRGALRSICTRLFRKHKTLLTPWYVDKVEYLVICRPPPRNVQLKKRKDDANKPIVQATEKDEIGLDALAGAFMHEDDSSSSDEE